MKRLLFILVLVLIYFFYDLLFSAGYFTKIVPHFDGEQITIYRGVPGPEDIEIDYERGLLFVSSTDRWKQMEDSDATGDIYLIRPDSSVGMKRIWNNYQGQFRPHGISFLKTPSRAFLFVINHNNDGNFVEKFEYKNDSLYHLQSYQSDLMFSPNDLVAMDENKFYVTNDHGFGKGSYMRTLEDYLRLPKSYVLYYDGEDFSKVVDKILYANGINVSNDGNQLYLAQTTGQEFRTYDIAKDGSLELTDRIKIKSGLDNIEVDPNGKIWIGSHPKLLDFVAHSKDSQKLSPSQVYKVEFINERNVKVTEVFLDDGSNISGSSVAVPYKNDLYVGVVFEDKIFRGRMRDD